MALQLPTLGPQIFEVNIDQMKHPYLADIEQYLKTVGSEQSQEVFFP